MDPARAPRCPFDRCGLLGRIAGVVLTALAVLVSTTVPALAAPPAAQSPLPAAIEAYQPYVGQAVCDPVAKPGVRAFSTLVLNAYRGTTSLGIVRDCGIGSSSEHKEGRAWDWGVSAYNPTHAAQVKELLGWLMATDKAGNPHANLRRLGIMYVIWNKQIFKSYSPGLGWRPYSGASPHTDHVHFSFGWAGAKKTTSFWDGSVAAVDPGPTSGPPPAPVPTPVVPVPAVANLEVLARFGATTLRKGSTGDAVQAVQRPLRLTADGHYGSATEAAVAAFQRSQNLGADGVFGPMSWRALFPRPTRPYGELELLRNAVGRVAVKGWALDAEVTSPVRVHVYVDGRYHSSAAADLRRDDVAADNPGTGTLHGYDLRLALPEGTRKVCTYAINAPGTPGGNALLGCASVVVSGAPAGALSSVAQGPTGVIATGWALDPDVAAPISVDFTVDGRRVSTQAAAASAPGATRSYADHGTAHGFRAALAVPDGTHVVCAVGRNAAGTRGADRRLGCVSVTVRHHPTGAVDAVVPVPGKVVVSGWTVDPDRAAPVGVHIYVDGRFTKAVAADRARSTMPASLTAYGRNHGFVAELSLPEGTRTICAFGLNAARTPGRHAGLGCHKVVVRHTPFGSLDSVTTGIGGVSVTGWAIDPDVTAPVSVQVLVDGRLVKTLAAGAHRPDLARVHKLYGPAHGVRTSLSLTEGAHSVCLRGVNAAGTPGSLVQLGCRSVTVRHSPVGVLDQVLLGPDGVRVVGWALDPDTAASVRTEVRVGGRKVAERLADVARPDLAARNPAYGPRHGVQLDGLVLPLGSHSVCLVALDAAGPGRAVQLGCRSIRVEQDAKGALEAVTSVAGGAAVSGWALDPDTAAPTKVHLFVDGKLRTEVTATRAHAGAARSWPLHGSAHGYSTRLALTRGAHVVCAWNLNAVGTPGRHTLVGCRRVSVA